MKKIVALTVFGMIAGGADAIEISFGANRDRNLSTLTVGVSQSGSLSIFLNIGTDDGNVAGMVAFFDATPLRQPATEGYEVVGRNFRMTRDTGQPWFRAIPWDGGPNMERYALIASDDPGGNPIGTDGDGNWYEMDEIIVHGRVVGQYELFFENPESAESAPRLPSVVDRNGDQHPYNQNMNLPGHIHFTVGWWDVNVGPHGGEFRVPFLINVTPEPTSFVLLALGGLALLRRRVN
jgi:hypothetical protein